MIAVRFPAADDLTEIVEALIVAADACEQHAPDLAARRRALANGIGDALDSLPQPTIREDHFTP